MQNHGNDYPPSKLALAVVKLHIMLSNIIKFGFFSLFRLFLRLVSAGEIGNVHGGV